MSDDIGLQVGTNTYDIWVRKDWLLEKITEALGTDEPWGGRIRDRAGDKRLPRFGTVSGPNDFDYLYLRIEQP